MRRNHLPPLVLHIEDDDGDAHLVVRALAQGPIRSRIARAADGLEAISMLKAIKGGEMETPDLVLLDMNLPFYSGLQILDWLAENFGSKTFPIVVFSSCAAPENLDTASGEWCDEYVVKPVDAAKFQHAVDSICERYLTEDRIGLDPDPAAVGVA